MEQENPHSAAMMLAGLNLIQQALSIYDSDLRLVTGNRMFREMFDLPPRLTEPGARFEDTIRHLVERGEYGPIDDVEAAVATRVEQARAFAPHYMERTRANGRVISVEGAPLPEGGWITVYTDITHTKTQEELLRARSEELSDKLLAYAEELSATNRQLASTIAALQEAKRQVTETEARTRLTTEMMPAHIAHVGRDMTYTFSGGHQPSWACRSPRRWGTRRSVISVPGLRPRFTGSLRCSNSPMKAHRVASVPRSPPTAGRMGRSWASTCCPPTSPRKHRPAPPCNRHAGARWRRN